MAVVPYPLTGQLAEYCKSTFEQGYQKCADDPTFCCIAADAVDQACIDVTYQRARGIRPVFGDFRPFAKTQLEMLINASCEPNDFQNCWNTTTENLLDCGNDTSTCCDGLQKAEHACAGTAYIDHEGNHVSRYTENLRGQFEELSGVSLSECAWTCDHEHEDEASCTDSGSTWTHGDNDGKPGCINEDGQNCWCCKQMDQPQ